MFLAESKESFRMALGALAAHKLRSALTLVGVLVGVFSIIVVMTAMRVLQRNIEKEMTQLGATSFQIQKWPALHFDGKGRDKIRRRRDLTLKQVQELRARAHLPSAIGAELGLSYGEVSSDYAKTNPDIGLMGITPEGLAVKNWTLESGRGFVTADMLNATRVCILSHAVTTNLFPFGAALGQPVQFDGVAYTVVGVLEARGGMFGESQDKLIAIPLSAGLERYGQRRSLSILVQAPNAALLSDCMEQVRGVLRALRTVPPGDPDDFELFTNDSLINQFRDLTRTVRLGVIMVSSIALLTAGIGIMNIMLVSVTERTREIGIRRAIGARKSSIRTQFLVEAVVICQVGGALGVALGLAGGLAAARLLKLPPVIPLDWIVISLVICSAVGIIFGLYPAVRAANLDPIDSLRYE